MTKHQVSIERIEKKEWTKPVFEKQSLKDALNGGGQNDFGGDDVNGTKYS